MATAKTKTAAAVVPAKKTAGAVVNIQDLLRKEAAAVAEKTAPVSGMTIRTTQDKQFVLPDGRKSPGPIDVVILEFGSENRFYGADFDAKNIQPPKCFAIGSNPLKLVPSDNSPEKQSDSCATCPQNQFGSAPRGDGKACKNTRVLAVLPPDADESTPIWILRTSPTAIKAFDGYVASVARQFGVPPVGVVTEVAFDDSVTYAKLTFGNPRPNEKLEEMFSRREEASALLAQEPDVSGYETPQPKKATVRSINARR